MLVLDGSERCSDMRTARFRNANLVSGFNSRFWHVINSFRRLRRHPHGITWAYAPSRPNVLLYAKSADSKPSSIPPKALNPKPQTQTPLHTPRPSTSPNPYSPTPNFNPCTLNPTLNPQPQLYPNPSTQYLEPYPKPSTRG